MNRLNADAMPELLRRLRMRGYIFVTLDSVMDDEAYATPDRFVGRYGPSWLHRWRVALGQPSRMADRARSAGLGDEGHRVGRPRWFLESPSFMRSRAHWRKWLERHHAAKTEQWLAYYKAHTGKPSVTYVEAVEEALCFGWIDGQVQRIDEESWVQRFTPRRKGSKWSKVNLRRFARLTAEGLVADAGRKAGPTKDTRVAAAFWEQPDVTRPR